MPRNIVRINNSDEVEWYVGDSKMEKLITLLDELGWGTDEWRNIVEQASKPGGGSLTQNENADI